MRNSLWALPIALRCWRLCLKIVQRSNSLIAERSHQGYRQSFTPRWRYTTFLFDTYFADQFCLNEQRTPEGPVFLPQLIPVSYKYFRYRLLSQLPDRPSGNHLKERRIG